MKLSEKFWFAGELDSTIAYWKTHYPDSCAHVLEQANNICRNTFLFREHWEMERTNKSVVFPEKIIWNRSVSVRILCTAAEYRQISEGL